MTERLHFLFSLSRTGEGNGNPLQCSCLENPRDGGAWWAVIYGVAQSPIRLKRLSSSSSMFTESVMPSSHLILCRPLLPSIFPSIRVFSNVSSSHQVAKVSEFQLQHQSFQRNPRADLLQNGLVGSPCSPRNSQESSPTPQFKSINSLALSLLHSPALTSIQDHRKNHSLD